MEDVVLGIIIGIGLGAGITCVILLLYIIWDDLKEI